MPNTTTGPESHDDVVEEWQDWKPPAHISVTHPWLARYRSSAILHHGEGPAGANEISTTDREIYSLPSEGDQVPELPWKSHSTDGTREICFRIGNGGAGYTGVLRVLAEAFLRASIRRRAEDEGDMLHGGEPCIAWVANHSRHSQVALLADVVQVALTYEPLATDVVVVNEKWARRAGVAFWDHFILVGPREDSARLLQKGNYPELQCMEAFRRIAERNALFHSRGDGSATFEKEQTLWVAAGVDAVDTGSDRGPQGWWLQTHPLAPYDALQRANQDGAYMLTDRATFLTANHDGIVPRMRVYVEGGKELLNPCSALVNTLIDSPASRMATKFADWLVQDADAQLLIRDYGKDWSTALPLFTVSDQLEFEETELLRTMEPLQAFS